MHKPIERKTHNNKRKKTKTTKGTNASTRYKSLFLFPIHCDYLSLSFFIIFDYFIVLCNFIDTARSVQSRVYETVRRPSVCLSVRSIIWPLRAAVAGLLLWARQPGDIDHQLLHGRRSAASASSVTLSADVGS